MEKGYFSKEYIGNHIKNIRKSNYLNLSDFSSKLGVSKNTVITWEKGKFVPNLNNIIKICNLFNVSIDSFILYK